MMKNQSPTSEDEVRGSGAKAEVSSTTISGDSKGPETKKTGNRAVGTYRRRHQESKLDPGSDVRSQEQESSSDQESRVRFVRDFMMALLKTNGPKVNVLKMNPEEAQRKKERKRMSNRESAKRKRQRDKREVDDLNKLCKELRDQNTQLQNRVTQQDALIQSERQSFAQQKAQLEGQVSAALQLAAAASRSSHRAPPPQFRPPQGGMHQLSHSGDNLMLQQLLQQRHQQQQMGQQMRGGLDLQQQQQQQGNDERTHSLSLQSLSNSLRGGGAMTGAVAAQLEDFRRRLLINGPEIQQITGNNEDIRRLLLSRISASLGENQSRPNR